MGYKAALRLVEIAKRGDLLGDSLVQGVIRVVDLDEDPELEKEAELYICLRCIDNILRPFYRYNCW